MISRRGSVEPDHRGQREILNISEVAVAVICCCHFAGTPGELPPPTITGTQHRPLPWHTHIDAKGCHANRIQER